MLRRDPVGTPDLSVEAVLGCWPLEKRVLHEEMVKANGVSDPGSSQTFWIVLLFIFKRVMIRSQGKQ